MQNNRVISEIKYNERKMTPKDKLIRLVEKYPELRETVMTLDRVRLRRILEGLQAKKVYFEEDENLVRLAYYIKYGYRHTRVITTQQILDSYLHEDEDTERIDMMRDQLVIVRDTRAVVNHKQREILLAQIVEQNENVLIFCNYPERYWKTYYPEGLVRTTDQILKDIDKTEREISRMESEEIF